MMLNKITLFSLLLFFLFGANVLAQSHLEKSKASPAQTEETTEIQTASADTETVMKEQVTITNEISSNEPSVMKYVLPAIIGLIIIFGFGSYWLIFMRKHI
jgi:copper resistance protein C